ncbi:MgtC/SapB family protein [bacterium]|nr:MgtC/SapB family protein [bacterium]
MEDLTRLGELLPRFIIAILVAIICGGLIGLERGLRHKSAGLRDNILICLGAVLYMIIAELIAMNAGNDVIGDPSRIAAHVVTGIGLICAAVILLRGKDISGLTNAATIWVVAAIGLIIGAGYPLLGMLVTAVTLLLLTMLHGVEKHISRKPRPLLLKLILREDNPEIRDKLQKLLEQHGVKPDSYRAERGPFGVKLTVQAAAEPEDIRVMVTDLWTIQGVTEVEH